MEEASIKHREIVFDSNHPDPQQGKTAALRLSDVPGVLDVQVISDTAIKVSYQLLEIDLQQIEDGLVDAGFHLSGKLIYKLKRALYYYTEETQRVNNGCPRGDSNCTRNVFVNRYSRLDLETRDPRPEHWREYL